MTAKVRSHPARNLLLFAGVSVGVGWLGHRLDVSMDAPPGQQLGMLLWIIGPVTVGMMLRAWGGDGWADLGWRPLFRGNMRWYALSLFAFPALTALVVGLGGMLGWVRFPEAPGGVGAFLVAFALGLPPMFLKNILEEFAWRGYLAPRVCAQGWNLWLSHLLVGVVWAAWHLPYYVYFLSPVVFAAHTRLGLGAYLPLVFVGLMAQSVLYGEIRLRTGSVWPAVLMHTADNAFMNTLLLAGFVVWAPGAEMLIAYLGAAGVGVWIHRAHAGP